MTPNSSPPPPWYREPFVWLLIAFPLTSVIVGFVGLTLAIRSDDGMVEDDYYRKGKEINRVLVRDQAAAAQGLESRVQLDDAHHELRVDLTALAAASLPENIEIKFLHATRAGLDRSIVLARRRDGSYRAPLPELALGHWHVQLAAQDWRLTGSIYVPGERVIEIRPALP